MKATRPCGSSATIRGITVGQPGGWYVAIGAAGSGDQLGLGDRHDVEGEIELHP